MPASQLTEQQKKQIVEHYRAGDSSGAVAKRFGCSDRTVMRLVRAQLSTSELEALKEKNRKRSAATQAPTATEPAAVMKKHPSVTRKTSKGGAATGQLTEEKKKQIVEHYRAGDSSGAVAKRFGCSDRTVMRLVRAQLSTSELEALKEKNRKQSAPTQAPTATRPAAVENDRPLAVSLPWEDADDFAESGGRDDRPIEDDGTTPAVTSHQSTRKDRKQSTKVARATKLDVSRLPSPLYLLVERSVELQPQTLSSLHHLGPLDRDEQERQGLVLFSNVRQARRQCRRNQRVVKVADPKLLGKTAPHLLAQGISRLVVEGNLYALPSNAAPAQS